MELYLLRIVGDVDPEVQGPFDSENERLAKARAIANDSPQDGLFVMNIQNGKPTFSPFCPSELLMY